MASEPVQKPLAGRAAAESSAKVLVGPPAHVDTRDLIYSVAVHTQGPLFDKAYSLVNRRHSHFVWLVCHLKPGMAIAPPFTAVPTSMDEVEMQRKEMERVLNAFANDKKLQDLEVLHMFLQSSIPEAQLDWLTQLDGRRGGGAAAAASGAAPPARTASVSSSESEPKRCPTRVIKYSRGSTNSSVSADASSAQDRPSLRPMAQQRRDSFDLDSLRDGLRDARHEEREASPAPTIGSNSNSSTGKITLGAKGTAFRSVPRGSHRQGDKDRKDKVRTPKSEPMSFWVPLDEPLKREEAKGGSVPAPEAYLQSHATASAAARRSMPSSGHGSRAPHPHPHPHLRGHYADLSSDSSDYPAERHSHSHSHRHGSQHPQTHTRHHSQATHRSSHHSEAPVSISGHKSPKTSHTRDAAVGEDGVSSVLSGARSGGSGSAAIAPNVIRPHDVPSAWAQSLRQDRRSKGASSVVSFASGGRSTSHRASSPTSVASYRSSHRGGYDLNLVRLPNRDPLDFRLEESLQWTELDASRISADSTFY